MSHSFDSGQRPLNSHYRYESASVNDYDYEAPAQPRFTTRKPAGKSKWLKIGVPVALVIAIIAGVVVAVVVTRHKNASTSSTSSGGSGSSGSGSPGQNDLNVKFYTKTDAYGLPVYPTTVS